MPAGRGRDGWSNAGRLPARSGDERQGKPETDDDDGGLAQEQGGITHGVLSASASSPTSSVSSSKPVSR